MLQDSITDNMANTVLKQMGATSVVSKPAYINTVKFELSSDVAVVYLYEVKDDNSIYLERLEPYAMFIGEPKDEDELVALIKHDIERFKDALTSANFSKFIDVSGQFSSVNKKFESALLSPKTVVTSDLEKIEADIKGIDKDVETLAANAKNI